MRLTGQEWVHSPHTANSNTGATCRISNAALRLTNFISLGKLLDLSVPQFLIYKIWITIIPILRGFGELIHIKLIE